MIFKNNFEDCQLIFRLLLTGKSIYYSDSMKTRIGAFFPLISDNNSIHEFDKKIYRLIHYNFSEFKSLSELIGYELIREEHQLSANPDYKFYYFLIPIDIDYLKKTKLTQLSKGDALIIGALSIETNMGTQFINYKEQFLNKILEDPQNLLKVDINLKDLAKLFRPKSRAFNTERTMKKLEEEINSRIFKILYPNNYIQILKGYEKQVLISLGPAAFRFKKSIRQGLKENELVNKYILNFNKSDLDD